MHGYGWVCDNPHCDVWAVISDAGHMRWPNSVPDGWYSLQNGVIEGANAKDWHFCSALCVARFAEELAE